MNGIDVSFDGIETKRKHSVKVNANGIRGIKHSHIFVIYRIWCNAQSGFYYKVFVFLVGDKCARLHNYAQIIIKDTEKWREKKIRTVYAHRALGSQLKWRSTAYNTDRLSNTKRFVYFLCLRHKKQSRRPDWSHWTWTHWRTILCRDADSERK